MQKIFKEVNSLDKRCLDKYHLSEDILMENAAIAMQNYIEKNFKKERKILIVCGFGNNGADGIVLARLLHTKYKIKLYIPFQIKSKISLAQLERTLSLGVKITKKISNANIVVDCLFGSGLSRPLDEKSVEIIDTLNSLPAHKIACDIPSGINNKGQITKNAFKANTTITMGALKLSMFEDSVKDFLGNVTVASLGLKRKKYETKSNYHLLDKKDLKLPTRDKKDTHKGTYGHLAVAIGNKKGAGLISCETALRFGVGLVTAISKNENIPNDIMSSTSLPKNTTAIAIGMGLGEKYPKELLDNEIAKLIDADMFYDKSILKLLNKKNLVLTPHPKEFCSLLKMTNLVHLSVEDLQKNRFKYVKLFCAKFPNIVLLLKGANVIISQKNKLYVNTFGTSALSFGGSGDILSGLIASLLAQNYSSLDAAINGSLAHTLSALKYKEHNYSLSPSDLIEQIKKL